MKLTDDHIAYIRKDLLYRGLVLESLQDEIVDHICSAVEEAMRDDGKRFIDAYHDVLRSFGSTSGLRMVQKQTLLHENLKPNRMLRNYLTIAWRNLHRHSFYTAINVIGLATGLAACLVMVLFIMDELRYDQYNDKADRIYRLEAEVKLGDTHFFINTRSAPEGLALQEELPEVESFVRLRTLGSYLVKPENGSENTQEKRVAWADSTFFKIFSVPVLEGNAATALKQPSSVAISRSLAQKYFPNTSALGKVLVLDNNYHAKVTAVYEDMPVASHFHFDILISMIGHWPVTREAAAVNWVAENFVTYILLKPGANAQDLERKFPAFMAKHLGPELAKAYGNDFTMEKFFSVGNVYRVYMRPLTDIHLYSDVRGELEPNGNITYVYLFAVIAGFILVIACINFMNLATARSGSRAKEVGVRKVMGSLRSHLMRQFLTESILITSAAVLIAVGIATGFLPVFNNLSAKSLELPWQSLWFYIVLLVAAGGVGVLAGIYPAFFLSAFRPVNVLKGRGNGMAKSGVIRSALVVFQFVISVFMIVSALTVNRQMQFIQNKKLGFDKEQVIIVHDAYALRPNNVEPFKNEGLKSGAIESATISGHVPVEGDFSWRSNSSFWSEGVDAAAPENIVSMQNWSVDYDYIKTFRLHVSQGRDFSADFLSDSSAVILNKTAVDRFGLGDNPIGKRILTFRNLSDLDLHNTTSFTVIGVIDDFHFSSMKRDIAPLGLFLNKSDGNVSFRFKSDRTAEAIQHISSAWKRLAVGQPFQYSFLDEDFGNMYRAEQRLGQIFSIFAGLAIIIACLGLFALTAFTAEQRTKEIGIRKVLGASVGSIVLLLSRDFGKLVVIAFVIAAPLAWYAANWWLKGYTYKTEIGVLVFIIAGSVTFIIAMATMSYQSIKAAGTNPVESLRAD